MNTAVIYIFKTKLNEGNIQCLNSFICIFKKAINMCPSLCCHRENLNKNKKQKQNQKQINPRKNLCEY